MKSSADNLSGDVADLRRTVAKCSHPCAMMEKEMERDSCEAGWPVLFGVASHLHVGSLWKTDKKNQIFFIRTIIVL